MSVKLAVPYLGALQGLDARLVRLAEFLGVPCETVELENSAGHAEFLERSVSDQCSCFAVNPQVLEGWVGESSPAKLAAYLLTRFTHLVVYGLRSNAFDNDLVAALSQGRLQSVQPIGSGGLDYEVAREAKDICGPFSGLSFGPANPANDHVFSVSGNDSPVRKLISIGGHPFMALIREGKTEVILLAGDDVADLNSEVDDAPLAGYFSRFLPFAMALRYAAGHECWRPSGGHATIIIDDPLLRKNYGFLNFDSLLRLADQHNFHVAIAFIPYNFRRNSPRITRMFRENAARLSICFHGNDHTAAEFASTNVDFLDTLLRVAEERMDSHHQKTGLGCDKVMVFPQGNFSLEAMRVLQAHNFQAAVNTVTHPKQEPTARLTLAELSQPAVLRYGGFPLFVRKPIRQIEAHDIAFNLFFGRPVLIVEHHEIYERPETLVEIAARINSVAPEVRWCNLSTGVGNSVLTRNAADGLHHVRAYSGTVRLSNDSNSVRRFSIEWGESINRVLVDQVLVDGTAANGVELDDSGPRLLMELAPGCSKTVSLVHRSVQAEAGSLGLKWRAQAFVRRRLSEMRDNHLSKNPQLLTAAKAFQKRFLKV